jgi:hypothetical protein
MFEDEDAQQDNDEGDDVVISDGEEEEKLDREESINLNAS